VEPTATASNGPGKYDDEATLVRERTGADGVVVMIHRGDKGHGFAVQGTEEFIADLPRVLEEIARGIRKQQRQAGH
jgi:hypothetical protein